MIWTRKESRDAFRRGQGIVEFALVLPIFLLLLFGAIELGRAYLDKHLLTNAAREGARVGTLPSSTEPDVTSIIDDFLTDAGMTAGSWQTSVVVRDSGGTERAGGLAGAQAGDRVYVTVTYNFNVLVGSIVPGLQGGIQLRGNCVFRRE